MSFNGFLNTAENINNQLNGWVWGTPMLALILLTGVIMTVGTGFFQAFRARHWLKQTAGSLFCQKTVTAHTSDDDRQISQFQALCTALAATIGTGNIAGVATAIAVGGPGAIFWMWVSAFFGMMTSYAENVLGIYYRRKNSQGEWCGGPMYYLSDGLSCKRAGRILAVLFSFFCICASFGIGNMTQVNSISSAMKSSFGIDELKTGVALAVVAALVIVGGVKRIGAVTEKLVPFMSFFYIGAAVIILISNFRQIPYVFSSIVSNAFSLMPVAGAGSGLMIKRAVSFGFKRGVFSNEAGLGSSVMVNCASNVREPAQQGMWGIFEVFFDTVIVCSLTAFVLLSSTCDAVSFEEAISDISKVPRYVAIYDIDDYKNKNNIPLMDVETNPIIELARPGDKVKGRYSVKPAEGEAFDIYLKKDNTSDESNYVYTNMMTVRGISLDESGAVMQETGAPVNAVQIEKIDGVPLVTYAFSASFGNWAGRLLAIAVMLFAFSTVIGWSYYGVKAWEFLFGQKTITVYKMLFVAFIVVGATMSLGLAWGISDTLNGLMALPNLIGVLAMAGTVFKITRNYIDRNVKGKNKTPMISAFDKHQH